MSTYIGTQTLPALHVANAHFVTTFLAVGGDLAFDNVLASEQAFDLVDAGVTHVLDVRHEADDAELWSYVPEITYRWDGIDDAGQRVPATWFDGIADWALAAIAAAGSCSPTATWGSTADRAPATPSSWPWDGTRSRRSPPSEQHGRSPSLVCRGRAGLALRPRRHDGGGASHDAGAGRPVARGEPLGRRPDHPRDSCGGGPLIRTPGAQYVLPTRMKEELR